MTTAVTRGPKVCPSCGKENPPTAARCLSCLVPLNAAVQTTQAPAPPEMHDSDFLCPQPPSLLRSNCFNALLWCGLAVLIIVSAGVTFFLTCLGVYVSGGPGYPVNTSRLNLAEIVATVAAMAVAALMALVFYSWQRRR